MRPGCAEDLPPLIGLWEQEVRAGRRELGSGAWFRRAAVGFDWESYARVSVGLDSRWFADDWRHSDRTEQEVMATRPLDLALLAVAPDGNPAAITLGQLESYRADPRPQPVGIVASVGTLPDHRRRGLAGWLVAECGACAGQAPPPLRCTLMA